MHSLQTLFHRVERRLQISENFFDGVRIDLKQRSTLENWALLEGLVSMTWQTWCLFCRQLVIASGSGCVTRSGIVLTASVNPPTWQRISYIAKCVKSNSTPRAGRINTVLRHEPTWGNTDSLIDIISVLDPPNKSQLLSAFGPVTRGPNHLQTVRNASAHLNHQTFSEVKKLIPYYQGLSLRHPIDLALWIEPSSENFAFAAWLDEMRSIAERATN